MYGGWDSRLIDGPDTVNPNATRAERYFSEAQSAFTGAENLLNVPLFVTHGDSDPVVDVTHSRHAVKMLQRWGYDVRYREMPGWAHEELDTQDQIVSWLLTHQRNSSPRAVRVRAATLRDASAHWVRVQAWNEPLQIMRVDAEVMAPGLVRLDTDNVASVELSPPRELMGADKTLRVVWNGEERSIPLDANGTARVTAAPDKKSALPAKSPALEGGLSNFFTTPFVVVVGTTASDLEMRKVIQEKADALAQAWKTWQHVPPRMLTDAQVTPEIERQYSLLLVGGANANAVSRRMASRLPLQVARDSVTLQGRKFKASDAVAQMIYPNPSQPDRYVLLVAATSPAGMREWRTDGYVHPVYGYPTLGLDWVISDSRRAQTESAGFDNRYGIASGAFDLSWRRDDRWTFLGDEKLRAVVRN